MKKHPQLAISLSYGLRDIDSKITKWYANRSASVRSELNQAVSTHFINCPACGGLIPDLDVHDKERIFRFTCTRIVENGKTIARTDYTKLLYHLLAKELHATKHFTQKDLDSPLRDFVKRLIKKMDKKQGKKEEKE